jgi:hypothetical protein
MPSLRHEPVGFGKTEQDEQILVGLGQMETLRAERNCSVDRCECGSVAFLAEQALCLNHFVARCYDQLDRIDPRGRSRPLAKLERAKVRDFVEECSDQALNVCLQAERLSNLERGRLLDILLWAGELYAMADAAADLPFADNSQRLARCFARTSSAKRA